MSEALSGYHKRLFVFLSVATFFEGYDFLALSQILPNLLEEMSLPAEMWSGIVIATVNAGTVAAFFLVRTADRIGRRRLLTITIAGYTVFTFATGFAPNVYYFMALQFVARVFLIGEWAVSMVIAAEEFPASKRGFVIGVIQACSSLGSIFCAGVVPLLLKVEVMGHTPGWRSVYFVGVVPLLVLAFARRNLKETKRFEETGPRDAARSFLHIWSTPYIKRVLVLALIWAIAYIPAQNAVAFWKFYATDPQGPGLTDGEVGLAISIAALISMPFIFYVGRMLDRIGRKRGAVIIFGFGALGVAGCYLLEGFVPLTVALTLGIFAATAYMPILNSYSTELFPTDLRADAFGWANNLLGRLSYVTSPILIGFLAQSFGFGPVVASTSAFNLVVIVLIFALLPETKGRELEDTAALESSHEEGPEPF